VDNLASCFLGTQLSGATFWVLPNDYVIQSPILKEYQLSQGEVMQILFLLNKSFLHEMVINTC
jgi:hypothetical protein